MKNKFICIHGHFYQPPRENPWTEEVETEESAAPDHDWNERIFRECYAANLESPIQDAGGKVLKTVNNYEHISFDFGPTLLSWLERRRPEAYAQILSADAASRSRSEGRGNAMAQAFNHIILPLAGRRDKLTQIRWGLADFEARFGRRPEGMWLPETAADDETLECLIAEGLGFVLLAPSQAAKVRPLGGKEADWTEASAGSLDSTRPYRWLSGESPGRGLDVIFYHDALSRAVAFERILNDGERFAKAVLGGFSADDSPQLVCLATDGESYGHHHSFGNMALAYAVERLHALAPAARLVNPAQILRLFAPKHEVRIRPKTSWSCAHGIGRWREDCGCSSGAHPAWNQKWRKPLRDTLDWLADVLDRAYEDRAAPILRDPWAARDDYIRRLLDPSPEAADRFLARHARKRLSMREAREALALCELQRHRTTMFTSCGWFFDEISGLETVQALKYAARAMDLARSLQISIEGGLEEAFLGRLKAAPSNLPQFGDGAQVYRRLVLPLRAGLRRAAAHFAILDHLRRPPALAYSLYEIQRSHPWRSPEPRPPGLVRASGARLSLRHRLTLETLEAAVAVWDAGGTRLECRVRSGPGSESPELARRVSEAFLHGNLEDLRRFMDVEFDPERFSLEALFPDDRRRARELPKDRERALPW